MLIFFVSNPNGIEGTLNARPALSFHLQVIFENGIRKNAMTTAPPSLKTLREEAAHCRACHLWKDATQTVFGEGPQTAQVMLVGEQPGDKEECGQTFQVCPPRENPTAPEADDAGNQGVPAMV